MMIFPLVKEIMSGGLYAACKTRGLLSLPWSRDYNCALKISTCIMKTILSLLLLLPVLASAQPAVLPGETADETTDGTTSHLTSPASEKLLDGHPKDARQVIGYSHSARLANNSDQVAGYRLSKNDSQVIGYAAPQLAAKSYLLYDYTSNQILVNQNGDARMEPASLTKLMTAYLAFDALRHGTLSLEQKLNVPAAAVRNSGDESRMLLKAGQAVTVDELLHGLVVQSGNDAAITLAVNIAGSEAGFVDMMNQEAKRLGMNNTHFTNSVGLSDAQHYSSASDLAVLAAAILRDYPQHYPLFSLRNYTFNNVAQANRNRLLWLDPYADGMKTGHTESAGYCLVGSAQRDNHRLISVMFGADTDRLRATESQKLLNFGFQYFDAVRLFQKDQPVTQLRVWKGTESHLEVGFRQDLFLSIPKGTFAQLKAKMETHQPILAPITGGQQLGVLKLTLAGKPYAEFPLVALDSVPLANVFLRGWDSIRLIFQ
jgi:D-alanyl-D-alanine carboxypeptidase (penicillin-binding protein 5/6)